VLRAIKTSKSRKPRVPEDILNAARRMRRELTDPEARLWKHIKGEQLGGFRFRRQHPIGRYVLDFYCPAARLAVELDGGQHAEDCRQVAHDQERDRFLVENGIRVLRFWDTDVLKRTEAVLQEIWDALHTPGPPQSRRIE